MGAILFRTGYPGDNGIQVSVLTSITFPILPVLLFQSYQYYFSNLTSITFPILPVLLFQSYQYYFSNLTSITFPILPVLLFQSYQYYFSNLTSITFPILPVLLFQSYQYYFSNLTSITFPILPVLLFQSYQYYFSNLTSITFPILPVLLFQSYQFSRFVSFSSVLIRVANHRYNFFIAIIDKIFKIFAILLVIGDNFGKARNNIAEIISVLLCEYVSRYTLIFCTLHSSMAAFFVEDVSIEQMKGL